jgi:hypothetical protein
MQLKFIVKQNLTDQYIQNWFNQIENSSRGEFYGIFKNALGVFDHLPVSIGSLMLLHLNFVIMFLSCGNNFNKYFSKLNSFLNMPVNFWNRLISNEKKLSCILYKIMFNLSIIDNVQFKWLNFIKSIFEKLGLIIYGTGNSQFIQCN